MRITCECETAFTATLAHYDWCSCPKCGKEWWALKPQRFGQLVAFPMPQEAPAVTELNPPLLPGWNTELMQNGGQMTKRQVELVALDYAGRGKKPVKH